MPAATLQEAIDLTPQYVQAKFDIDIPTYQAALESWIDQMFGGSLPGPGTPFDPTDGGNLTVLYWAIPTQWIWNMRAGGPSEISLGSVWAYTNQMVCDVVVRCLYAVQYAVGYSRITADQGTSVLAAFNTAWA